MRHYFFLSVFLFLSKLCLCQLTNEFKKLDNSKSYIGLTSETKVQDCKARLELKIIDSMRSSAAIPYEICNKKFLRLDSVKFDFGKIIFTYGKLANILYSVYNSDSANFNKLISYLSNKFGVFEQEKVLFKNKDRTSFSWGGKFLAFTLFHVSEENNSYLGIDFSQ